MKEITFKRRVDKFIMYAFIISTLFIFDYVFADAARPAVLISAPKGSFGAIGEQIVGSYEEIGKLIVAISYLAGIGFGVSAIFKFKQHKDNPTQVPIGTPLALLAISAALVFIPMFYGSAGSTVFVDKATAGGFEGQNVIKMVGGGS